MTDIKHFSQNSRTYVLGCFRAFLSWPNKEPKAWLETFRSLTFVVVFPFYSVWCWMPQVILLGVWIGGLFFIGSHWPFWYSAGPLHNMCTTLTQTPCTQSVTCQTLGGDVSLGVNTCKMYPFFMVLLLKWNQIIYTHVIATQWSLKSIKIFKISQTFGNCSFKRLWSTNLPIHRILNLLNGNLNYYD